MRNSYEIPKLIKPVNYHHNHVVILESGQTLYKIYKDNSPDLLWH